MNKYFLSLIVLMFMFVNTQIAVACPDQKVSVNCRIATLNSTGDRYETKGMKQVQGYPQDLRGVYPTTAGGAWCYFYYTFEDEKTACHSIGGNVLSVPDKTDILGWVNWPKDYCYYNQNWVPCSQFLGPGPIDG